MQVLIYVGPAPSRDLVIQYSAQIVQHVATSVALVTGGGNSRRPLLEDAARRLATPGHVPVTLHALRGDAQTAILRAAAESDYDLVIFGRLNQPISRLLPGPHSKAIAERLEPSVLRVNGAARPIKRVLVASGGDYHTFDDVGVTLKLAAPLGASATLLHVISQQSLIFDGFVERGDSFESFLASAAQEAEILRKAVAMLRDGGVPAEIKGRVGPVLDEIMEELRVGSYDLLVAGAHRATSALDWILLEDITGELLDLSPLPVLVAKGNT